MNEYNEHFITTYTGKKFHYLNPARNEVCIEDIAHALSLTCRFGGHCEIFYSVAEHSCRVSDIVSEENKLCALLYDASEAYITDIPRPIMIDLPQYWNITTSLQDTILSFLCDYDADWRAIKWADDVLLATESRDIMHNTDGWAKLPPPLEGNIFPVSPEVAEVAFLERYKLFSNT